MHRHFLATVGTLIVAAKDRKKLLDRFFEFRRTALSDKRVYGLSLTRNDPHLLDQLSNRLQRQGIEVSAARKDVRLCGASVPKGSLLVRAGQPAGRLVQELMDAKPYGSGVSGEQERRRKESWR